jgi:suppressor for copper-sensitivity B
MQVRKYISSTLIGIFFVATIFTQTNAFANATRFKSTNDDTAKSRIIASFYQKNGQKQLIAGFEINLKKGWKIYAPDNSGFGITPSFNFEGSSNITNSNPIFPKALTQEDVIGEQTIKYKVYENRVIIPIKLDLKDNNQATNLAVEVTYGLCKEICIPVTQKFSLNIPGSKQDEQVLQNIQQYLEKEQIIAKNQEKLIIYPKISLIKALIIAFIGGAILNIMPCVLPVLSIKLLSIINHSRTRVNKVRFAYFSTILGIIFSFTVFAILAATLKSLGNSIGWGFQFQNPYFLLFLLIVLMIFISNLLGMFEFKAGSSLGGALDKKITAQESRQSNNIFIPNFLSGILAVLLATPCSAPFVGVAVSFALSAEILQIFLIFITMGFGLSLPYLILIIFPRTAYLLPKPGKWMITAKNIMAGFLAATAIWVIYILCDNIGFISAIAASLLAILILPFFKIIQKFNISKIVALVTFSTLISLVFVIPSKLSYLDKMMEKAQQEYWIKFDQSQINNLVNQGKTVVVDITADWCITCKANKILVLNSSEIREKLAQENIVAMRGDLTKPNDKIFNFMKKYNRYGIPFNIVFGPNAKNGILTSELLSKEALLEAIEKASNK